MKKKKLKFIYNVIRTQLRKKLKTSFTSFFLFIVFIIILYSIRLPSMVLLYFVGVFQSTWWFCFCIQQVFQFNCIGNIIPVAIRLTWYINGVCAHVWWTSVVSQWKDTKWFNWIFFWKIVFLQICSTMENVNRKSNYWWFQSH